MQTSVTMQQTDMLFFLIINIQGDSQWVYQTKMMGSIHQNNERILYKYQQIKNKTVTDC